MNKRRVIGLQIFADQFCLLIRIVDAREEFMGSSQRDSYDGIHTMLTQTSSDFLLLDVGLKGEYARTLR